MRILFEKPGKVAQKARLCPSRQVKAESVAEAPERLKALKTRG